ncbi:hypothetical protein C7999DRAFT_16707 [Corynascus novoguineensis]|uniref:Uncharacterized protein n=1 Tax=Corynascus novoguineensis TaxID=1126955 RepID=A0AAN7HME3_9PEZI|nr:hypothetical protein C7999DRAFT_16707 [Corynascus novoguineensis]
MSPLADFNDLPGLRDYSGKQSHSKGVNEILDVVRKLAAVQIPSCVVGVKALFYYGASREWDLCIPDEKIEEAKTLLLSPNDSTKYEAATPPPPVPWSRRHMFPCLRLKGFNFWFILVPSSDCLVDPSVPDHVERSRSGVPYASLVQFARSLLVQQLRHDVADLVDGMNLDVDWGMQHVDFDALQKESAKFIDLRNRRVKEAGDGHGFCSPKNMERLWRDLANEEAKERRIEPMKKSRYLTRWQRIKDPRDPREKDRPV